MKRITALTLILVVSILTAVSTNATQDREVTLDIAKMTCAACPITVSKAMKRVNGVKEVAIDFDAKTATVTYDASLTNATQISEASGNVGFPASVIEDGIQ